MLRERRGTELPVHSVAPDDDDADDRSYQSNKLLVFGIFSSALFLFMLLTSSFPAPPAGQQISNSLSAPASLKAGRILDLDTSLSRRTEATKLEKPANSAPVGDESTHQIPSERVDTFPRETVSIAPVVKAATLKDVPSGAARFATVVADAKSAPSPPLELPPQPRGAPSPGKTTLVHCTTTKGPLDIAVYENWSPHGTPRFIELVETGFFHSKVALFRAIKGWICQFGVSGDPSLTKFWRARGNVLDDPQWLPKERNRFKRGMVSFAGGGKNTRGTEMFVAYSDTALGAAMHEVPFGLLVGDHSYSTLDAWYTGYGDVGAFGGHAPAQGKMYNRGLAYLQDPEAGFPLLDYITGCNVTWQSQ